METSHLILGCNWGFFKIFEYIDKELNCFPMKVRSVKQTVLETTHHVSVYLSILKLNVTKIFPCLKLTKDDIAYFCLPLELNKTIDLYLFIRMDKKAALYIYPTSSFVLFAQVYCFKLN